MDWIYRSSYIAENHPLFSPNAFLEWFRLRPLSNGPIRQSDKGIGKRKRCCHFLAALRISPLADQVRILLTAYLLLGQHFLRKKEQECPEMPTCVMQDTGRRATGCDLVV